MALSDIVNVQITATSGGVTQQGFGTMLILSATAAWAERTRAYSDIVGVAADFATTSPEYQSAAAAFSQVPRPQQVVIGRLANKPTQKRTITPNPVNSTVYKMTVNGVDITYTSDASATAAEIVTGLIAAFNALPGISSTATGSTTLVITANAAGLWDNVSVADPSLLALAQDHADPGVAADLDAIKLVDNTWYAISGNFNSKAVALAIAAWAEANKRLYLCHSQDTDIIMTVPSGATDVAGSVKAATYKYTTVWYHQGQARFSAALGGRCLPLDPGSETWAFKTLATCTPTTLSTTQRNNALGKNANVYEQVAGRNITEFGTVGDGEYIDVIRFIDWLVARIGEACFGTLADNIKVPYTDQGIAMLATAMIGVLKVGVQVGGLASFTPAIPKAKDALPADRAARVLKGLNFAGLLAGAAHTVQVNGTVSPS